MTAFAKLQCSIPPKHFIDLLTLVMLEGRWQIVAKVFHYKLESDPNLVAESYAAGPGTKTSLKK